MSENGNKRRLIAIGGKVKEARDNMGLTQEEFADKYGYARTTLAKLEAGHRDFKSTEIVTLAEQLNVSCDYLLGRSRAAAPDNFMQEVVTRYGLNEDALKLLERLNAPLDIDAVEKERVIAKYRAITETYDKFNVRIGDKITPSADNIALGTVQGLTADEMKLIERIMQEEANKQALAMLNDVLVTSTDNDWETYGLQIFSTLWDYCYRKYKAYWQERQGITGATFHEVTPEKQSASDLQDLTSAIVKLREKLKVKGD